MAPPPIVMLEADTFKALKSWLPPKALANNTRPWLPEALSVNERAVWSLSTLSFMEMTALLPVASRLTSRFKVTAPV